MDTTELARFLIGKTLVHDLARARLSGRIVETEAYPIGDAAGHAFRGRTPANRSVFLAPGHAYVHFSYGSSVLINVSSEPEGTGGAVLIRGIEPVEGIEEMTAHRGVSRVFDLTRGPGRLTIAMKITKALDGADLCGAGPLWLGAEVRPTGGIAVTTRIGLSQEAHRLLRFYERENPFVSGPKRLLV